MSYYRYQYKQQCYMPGGMKCSTPMYTQQCQPSGVMKCAPCPPCAPAGTKVCTVRKTLQSPRCSPCSSGCVETHIVEGHSSSSSSSCGSRCLNPCSMTFSQPQSLCMAPCGPVGVRRCSQVCAPAPQVCAPAPQVCAPAPQVCAPAPLYQYSSSPYSYQWSNSYQYNCGQQ